MLVSGKNYFEQVEKSPLTQEQIEAVLCFDDRVLLVAAAGSGKTSVMVAKAGYAIRQNYFTAQSILMLAFNRDAAKELGERVVARLTPLNIDAQAVATKTFHAFGMEVIGAATGRKPSVPGWLESGKDIATLQTIVDEQKDADKAFRAQWDLFRIVLSQDLPDFGKEQENPDSYDRTTNSEGFWTLNNETVKSRGEQMIANWLFYNGVQYVYEQPYPHDTATATHSQYRPDFYFPGIDAYLEHWAVDENGDPPASFHGYKEGMAWKRQLHQQHSTKLLETTMADLWAGHAFAYLERELTALGLDLDPNPDRAVPGRQPIQDERLLGTFRSFLTHTKSNRLSMVDLRERLQQHPIGQFRFRHTMFLQLFERLWDGWEKKLQAERSIDFEDMLNQAADHIEQQRWKNPYQLVMVDEFQDASQARARLVNALMQRSDSCLFAVGDDWQSINRFAGADLAVMTSFERIFGSGQQQKLETTFRCPQALCDISSQFVQKNPRQIKKNVRSKRLLPEEVLQVYRVPQESMIQAVVVQKIAEIQAQESDSGKATTIYVIGRYKNDQKYLPKLISTADSCTVTFETAHGSKGLEADHVIIPNMVSGTLGFPCGIVDDPVLGLAMPSGDAFAYAEERRLFYVALTRAKKTVTLITVERQESAFVRELVADLKLEIINAMGAKSSGEVCPDCQKGFLAPKTGRYGKFLGCTQYPRCKFTRKIK